MKIYNSIRKTTAPPTKLFNNKKDKLKNEYLNNEIEEEIYDMNEEDISLDKFIDFNKLKTVTLEEIYKYPDEKLDEPYIYLQGREFTIRELIKEIENETRVGVLVVHTYTEFINNYKKDKSK